MPREVRVNMVTLRQAMVTLHTGNNLPTSALKRLLTALDDTDDKLNPFPQASALCFYLRFYSRSVKGYLQARKVDIPTHVWTSPEGVHALREQWAAYLAQPESAPSEELLDAIDAAHQAALRFVETEAFAGYLDLCRVAHRALTEPPDAPRG
jgi:hypothetical protein